MTYSEASRTKCIGLTIETRPDYCHTPHLTQMLSYGCTRIEMGVQSVYEDVARDTNRGHSVAAVKTCFQYETPPCTDLFVPICRLQMSTLPLILWISRPHLSNGVHQW